MHSLIDCRRCFPDNPSLSYLISTPSYDHTLCSPLLPFAYQNEHNETIFYVFSRAYPSLDAFMTERGEVFANAKKVHAEGIKRAAERRQKSAYKEEEAAEAEAEAEAEEEAKKKGPSEPRWMLLYKAKFESYSELLST